LALLDGHVLGYGTVFVETVPLLIDGCDFDDLSQFILDAPAMYCLDERPFGVQLDFFEEKERRNIV
jgi:hypothetical protein